MHNPAKAPAASRLFAVLGLLGLLLAGCGATTSSPLPSPSLVYLSFSPLPAETAPASTFAPPSATLVNSWPPGWDAAFCAMFDNAVNAQQVIVDVERAITAKATKDAKGLAGDLTTLSTKATQQIDAMPDWAPSSQALSDIGGLMDYGTQAAAKYTKYFQNDNSATLKKARQLRRQDAAAVPATNSDLALLAETGLVCPKHALQLESP
jgi:hypothetical protein